MTMPKKILVVDDETGIRYLLWDVLSSNGFEVSMAKDGQESLEQMETDNFDLVITDIQMPRLDGIEMLRRMKKSGRKEKIIIMTGNISDRRLAGRDLPCVVSRLEKPFMMDNFLNTVVETMASGVPRRRRRAASVKLS